MVCFDLLGRLSTFYLPEAGERRSLKEPVQLSRAKQSITVLGDRERQAGDRALSKKRLLPGGNTVRK